MSKETFIKIFCSIVLSLYVILGVILITAAISSTAHADEESLWLTTGEWSRHDECNYKTTCQFRQNNIGLGIQYDLSRDSSVIAGWYNNSIHRETVYAGMTYTPWHLGDAKLGVVGAMATGYTEILPAVPIASLFGSYEYERVGINLYYLPTVVIAVQLKVRLK